MSSRGTECRSNINDFSYIQLQRISEAKDQVNSQTHRAHQHSHRRTCIQLHTEKETINESKIPPNVKQRFPKAVILGEIPRATHAFEAVSAGATGTG